MKASELRIGLWVYLFGDASQLTADNMVYLLARNSTPEPVTLTEEWLLKFGFEGDLGNGYGKDAIELGYITTDEHFQFEYATSHTRWMIVNIQYVHQLQNLYFALTGEELIIKA